MGKLKDQIVPEDEWFRIDITNQESNYMKNIHSMAENQQQYFDGMLMGFMKLIAIRNGYGVNDKLNFDIDFDENILQLKVKKID